MAFTSEQLDTLETAVYAAITAAIAGKAYTFQGRSVTRQDLPALWGQYNDIRAERARLSATTGSRMRVVKIGEAT